MTLDGIAIPIFTEQAVKSARGELGRTTSRSTLRPAQGERHDFKLTDYRPSATLVIAGAFRKLAPFFFTKPAHASNKASDASNGSSVSPCDARKQPETSDLSSASPPDYA